MCAAPCCARCGRKARVECTTPQKLMFISQSNLRLVDLGELAEQRHAGIVDDDIEAGMRRDRGVREVGDPCGFADIDAVHRDLALPGLRNLGSHALQAGFVAVGKREIAAARGKLERQRPADATGGSGHGGSGSTDRGHRRSLHPKEAVGGKPYTRGRLRATGARRAASADQPRVISVAAMSIPFLLTSLIVVASPGTGVLYTLAAALTKGSRASIAAAFGCTLGILPAMLAAMAGLAAVLHTSALAFCGAEMARRDLSPLYGLAGACASKARSRSRVGSTNARPGA